MVKMKGSFYTISGFLLVTLILTLSFILSSTLKQSNDRTIEAASLERAYNLEKSLNKLISKIDNNININITDIGDPPTTSQIIIRETINNTFENYGQDFHNSLLNLKSFIESNSNNIVLQPSILFTPSEKIPIVFTPYNLRYTHYNNSNRLGIKLTTDVSIHIYEININFLEETLSPNQTIDWITQNPGNDISITITATDYLNTTTTISKNLSADINEFSIGSCDISVNSYSPSSLDIDCIRAIDLELKSIPPYLDEQVTANYPAGLLLINISDFNILKNNSVRIV
jgi:hypothetical protein